MMTAETAISHRTHRSQPNGPETARQLSGRIRMSLMKTPRPATVEDLVRMPEDGYKYELVDGAIEVSPGGMRHAKVGGKIFYLLKRTADRTGEGEVYGPDVGLTLPNGNVRSPDVCYVRREKLPGGESPEGFGEVVPDLVVEVLSPGDRMRQVAGKIGEFLDAGTPLVWLVDPKSRTVTIYRSLSDTKHLTENDTIDAEPVLPGFSVRVSEFFG